MAALEHEQSPQRDDERSPAGHLAPDTGQLLKDHVQATASALGDVLASVEKPRVWRQGSLEFQPDPSETLPESSDLPQSSLPHSDAVANGGTRTQRTDEQLHGPEGSLPRSDVLFGTRLSSGQRTKTVARPVSGLHPPSRVRTKRARDERTLFDNVLVDSNHDEPILDVPATLSAVPVKRLSPIPLVAIPSGEKAKAHDIIAAIRVLKAIEQERRDAGEEERQTLARFAGFGPVALSIFPDPVTGGYKDASWQLIGEELRSLTTPEEYDSAKRTTFNAFYTSPTVITAMHVATERLGVPDTATILEPGCGSGNFMLYGRPRQGFIGIELDLLTGRIAKTLNPHQDIRIESFRDTHLPEGSVDAVIGNVPFADLKLEYRGQKFALHDYFFAKSIDSLKPGGVLALVTTHFTLDKQNAAIREYLAAKADFVGAIRLPSDAFKREGTSVVTDIIFMRKRSLDEPPHHADPEWLGVASLSIEDTEVAINRYFLNHPEMVLGTWSRKDTLYGEGFSVTSNGNLAEQLKSALERLPEYAAIEPSRREPHSPPPRPTLPERPLSEGSFFVDDHRVICQCIDGKAVPVVYGGTTLRAGGTMTGRRLAGLIRLRDLARRVLQAQNEGWPEADRNESRRELNWAYNLFVGTYGPINKTTSSETANGGVVRRMPNLVKFREDPDAMLVLSLEHYDDVTGKATKAAIMHKDVVGKSPAITSVRSAEEGLLVSLDRRGAVDLPFIASLYGKREDEIVLELGDLIFLDPECRNWQTADAYLSGNVRAKLAAVLNAGPAYARNAAILHDVQPEDVLPGDIDANLGAPWIPESDILAFAADLLQVEPTAIQVGHLLKDALWSIAAAE